MGKRIWIASASNAALWTAAFVALDKTWYDEYERSPFHFFNDNEEWNQMDKAGHVWSAYQVSRASSELWKWTGLTQKQSAILGGASGLVYEGIIEMQDAYSARWGFSWGDIAANVTGAGLYVFQELGWREQRIQVKMSYWPASYRDPLKARQQQLFGRSFAEQLFKDYNAQTYWLSVNLSSFSPGTGIPRWMNLALGYGARGLYGARRNLWTNAEGRLQDFSFIPRERIVYLSPDIDFTRIRTGSKALRTVFFLLNAVKLPAPSLEFSSKGNLRLRALKF